MPRSSAANIACVPHSATATNRACGNAAFSPLFTPGRPKNSSLTGVSATSRQVPSIATSRRPASHTPGVSGPPIGRATRANNAANGSDPNRSRAWKIADLPGNRYCSATPTPTTTHRSAATTRPHTSPPSTAPSRSRSTPSPAPATTDDAARCAPTPAITSSTSSGGNTRVSTPTDTRSDNRRSDSGFIHPARGIPTNYTACNLN